MSLNHNIEQNNEAAGKIFEAKNIYADLMPMHMHQSEQNRATLQVRRQCYTLQYIYWKQKRAMFTMKIGFKGKNVLLGKGIDSFAKIQNELRVRFPDELPFGAIIKYQGEELSDFSKVLAIVSASQMKSIKLEVEAAVQKEQIASPQISVQVVEEKKEDQLPQPKKEEVQQNFSFDSSLSGKSSQKEHSRSSQKKDGEKNSLKKSGDNFEKSSSSIKMADDQRKSSFSSRSSSSLPKVNSHDKSGQKLNRKTSQRSLQKYETKQASHIAVQIQTAVEPKAELKPLFSKEGTMQTELNEGEEKKDSCAKCRDFESLCQNEQFMKMIDQIVQKKIEDKLRLIEETIERKYRKSEMSLAKEDSFFERIRRSSLKLEDVKKEEIEEVIGNAIEFAIESLPANPEKVHLGEQFNWTFLLKTSDKIAQKFQVNIIDEKNGATMPIAFKDQQKIMVGPFTAEGQGKFEKNYRLFYFNQKYDMQYFGPRFGFCVEISKSTNNKQLQNAFRLKIDSSKKKFKLSKATDFYVEKLKEMGITPQNYKEMQDHLMEDIIQTL